MKDIRIFIASSKELVQERNELAFLVLAKEEEFSQRGLRVRLAKWEYVDPKMTAGRTEDRYLDEMYNCDAALVIFKNIAGMYTREELDKALAREAAGNDRLKAHRILFSVAGKPNSDAAKLRASLPEEDYGVYANLEELKAAFLALVDELVELDQSGAPNKKLLDAASEAHVRRITAFLAADDELKSDRNAFADTVLNLNELLEFRNLRVQLRFCGSGLSHGELQELVANSEMGLVLYGTNVRAFGQAEMNSAYSRTCRGENPKKLYVFFRDDEGKELSSDFKAFRDSFVDKLGHFACQFGGPDTLRLNFLLSLERYAGETIEIYSTVATPTAPVFVGREEELRKLHELLAPAREFPAGRLPVVTGAGGTGKSELVRQYASQFRVQYPGGVFQVDMENVRCWDDVFLGVLKGVSNNGVSVKDYLGLKDESQGDSEAHRHIEGNIVRDALLKKSRECGPVLLVLDNVEGCRFLFGRDGGFLQAFPAGFSEKVLVNVVATARVCDTMLRPADWAQLFPLGDLSLEAAEKLLLENMQDVDEMEHGAAVRVCELLGCRALFLRRVPSLIGDLYSDVICDSYVDLVKSLEENLLGTVAAETEETHLPDVLWKMSCERILKMPLGAESVKLAQVASFFSADGFAQHNLRYLWKTVVGPGLDDKKFARALEILRHHNIFQSIDPIRIHRLDRAAIQKTAKDEVGLGSAVGAAIATYGCLSKSDWIALSEHDDIRANLPDELAQDADFWVALLLANPKCSNECPWEKLNGRQWCKLLIARPQFAEYCEWEKLYDCFNLFGPLDCYWVELLCARPQFADRVSWVRLGRNGWDKILVAQPQLSDCCPWEQLRGADWSLILKDQPQFSDRCPWEILEGDDWGSLLASQPQFSEHCVWEKLNGYSWQELLSSQPQFADRCSWEKLDSLNWSSLLASQPQFASRCDWRIFDPFDWGQLLAFQPGFVRHCPFDMLVKLEWSDLIAAQPSLFGSCPQDCKASLDWGTVLVAQPQFAGFCVWKGLDGKNWSKLLISRPEFACNCSWDKLNGSDWCELLVSQPRFANECRWDKIDGDGWVEILLHEPQFANQCKWEKLCASDWLCLLKVKPQFSAFCQWDELDGTDWRCLLSAQPQFAEFCRWEVLSAEDIGLLVASQPQFSDRCNWDQLDGDIWSYVLDSQPQFADRCDWSKLSSFDWERLLARHAQFIENCPKEILCELDWKCILDGQPQLFGRCPLSQLAGGALGDLIASLPQFASSCPWEKLKGADWSNLLCKQPQYADRCQWATLDKEDWRSLLSSQPQFIDRCPCNCLDGDDWCKLLTKRPEFAEFCRWESLDGWSWASLLSKRPEFSPKCPWGLLDGCDWVELLAERPEFAVNCQWRKLDEAVPYEKSFFRGGKGGNWSVLLKARPEFANRCPWEILTGVDWGDLLCAQPQFADRCAWEKLNDGAWKVLLEKQPQFSKFRNESLK